MFELFESYYSKFNSTKDKDEEKVLIYSSQKKFKKQKYDKIFLPGFIGTSEDYQQEFQSFRKLIDDKGTLVITSINPIWGGIFGYNNPRTPLLYLWFIENLLEISNFKIVKSGYFVIPPKVPILAKFLNSIIPKIPKLKRILPFQFAIAKPEKLLPLKEYSVSVVIPMHNEEENVAECIKQVPKMGKFTEIIIVDDGSTDNTLKIAKSFEKKYKNLKIFSLKPNQGKVWAVKKGFDEARGDILMIWDADRTILAAELPRFYQLFATGQAEYVQGTRLAYPMEKEAMKFLNLAGNLFFGWVYSFLLNTRITDTLCGTKVMFKKDYQKIKLGTEPWGDFDLLFGAANLGLRIKEIPIHYKARIAGKSKMKTLRYGLVVTKMALKGVLEFKLIPFIKDLSQSKLILLIILLAGLMRFMGLTPNIPFHPDEGYTQLATHNLVVDIVSKGDFEPKAYKYGSLIFFINTLVYLPFLILTFVYYFLNNLSLNSSLAARPFMDTFLEIVYKNGFYIFLLERTITAIFGVASIFVLYAIAKKLFNKNIALLGALIFTITPLHVRDSHYLTTDIPFLFFVLLSFLCMVNLFQTGKLSWYILSGFFIGISSTIRYFPIALLVLPLAWIYGKKDKRWLPKIFLSLIFIPIGLLIGVPFLPFSHESQVIFQREMENLVLPFYGTSISAYATNFISYILSFGKNPLPDISTLQPGSFLPYHASFLYFTGFGILPTLAGLAGIVIGLIKYPKQSFMLLIIPIVNFIYISFYMHAVYQRLSIPILPFLSLFTAVFLFNIWLILKSTIKGEYKSSIFAVILIFVLFYPLSQSLISSYQCSKESVYATTKKWMDKNADPDIKLAYQPGLPFPSKNFTNHTEFFRPNKDFFLEEVRNMGKEYAFFNPASLIDYFAYSFSNEFFTPPRELYSNSIIPLALKEYESRAILLDKIEKNKLCEATEFYFYKMPELPPVSKNLQSGFYFDSESDLNFWRVQYYELASQPIRVSHNAHEGYTNKGSLEYKWENISYTAPRVVSKLIAIEPGKNYTLSAWIKSDNTLLEDQRDGFLRLDFYETDKQSFSLPGDVIAMTPRTYGEPGWRKVQVSTQAPNDMHFATISFQVTGTKGTGSFFIDDLEFYGPDNKN